MPISKIENSSIEDTAIHGARNLIINGAMQVAQRGTSFTDADTYALDRWRVNQSAETMAVTQQSFAAGQTDVPRAEKYLRVVVTTTGNFAGITQRIEGVEQLSGQTVTVSFYARGGQGGQGVPTTFRTYMNQNFGSGGSTAVNGHGSTNLTLTTSWQLFTATITLNSVSGQTIGTSPYTELVFQQTTGEACDFDIALVQLEIGDVATPFEHESFAATLQKCQRYFQKRVFTDADAIWVGANFNATSAYGVIEHIVTMRTEPSGAYSGTLADYKYYSAANTKTPTAMAINNRNSENSSETHIDWSGDLNSGGAGWLRAVGTNAFVQLEAEL